MTINDIDNSSDQFERVRETRSDTDAEAYEFDWSYLVFIIFLQALPSCGGLVFVAYSFKFALYADMNQGSIPSLFTLASIYVSIIFYFKFNEVISKPKILGILLMIPCVVILSLDKKDA